MKTERFVGRANGKVTVHGYGVSFGGDENVLALDSSGDCTTH